MSAKSTMLVAIVAFILCLSSTVVAADLYSPGSPVNCTLVKQHCKALAESTYLGKNASYSGSSSQCNVTNLSAAKPLCETKIVCLATFLTSGNVTIPAPVPTQGTNGTNSTVPKAPITPYIPTTMDMTDALIALYDTSKCGKNAAVAQAATSVGAMLLVGTIVSVLSTML
ncbi:hypothetical protein BG006_008230 [Podila minutissima]|uniref:Elicitin-like protein n=1 Tax=Podila minutissima TaxID=64525 RepID=A0A9P5VK40_9FUNG|nr:hypothetical protein BG006_008230 [Podila minutissima]